MKHQSATLLTILFLLCEVTLGAAKDPEWPITFETAKGRFVLYLPQPESFRGDRITARAAVSATPAGKTQPIFGAIWFEARVQTDRENRTVTIVEMSVPQVRFPNASPENQAAVAKFLEAEIPNLELTFSLDRLLTGLESAEKQLAADNALKNDPPAILVRSTPTLLVTIDGEPQLRAVPNASAMRVINTPYVILQNPSTDRYYLTDGHLWFSSPEIEGPWAADPQVPQEIRQLAPPDTSQAAPAAAPGAPPGIIVATGPTELIVTEGKPSYTPISGTDLLAISNTESDLFMDTGSQNHFVLLSGRWYRSVSLDGPWSFVPSDSLPPGFAEIPPSSPQAEVLPFVAGTAQAREAVLDASIPQTSAVNRSDTTLAVTYDGEPNFVRIEGTDLRYTANSEFSVLQVDGRFYCCHEAVWYESPSPRGPWAVADTVPGEIYEQPPSSPTYNTKYVYVYDTTPTVVYVGYLPGYTGCYVYGPTIVYGTGYYYPPYIGPVYYYPRPVTYGFHVRYNPYTGWGVGVTFGTGFVTFGMSWHSHYYPRPPYGGAYYRHPHHGYWGPGGYRPATTPHGGRATQQPRASAIPADRSNIYSRPANTSRNAQSSRVRAEQQPKTTRGGNNNVMADPNGNVYRKNQNGSWQKRESSGWSTPAPSTQPSQGQGAQSPSQQLERDRAAQQRGIQRSQEYNRQRQATPQRGGTMRSGGGRRR